MNPRYFFKRLGYLFVSLVVIATITFFLMHAIPGDPFVQDQAIPEEILKALHSHYGLDKPLFEQYLVYLKKIFTFSLGPSLKYEGRSVNQIISQTFPISLSLGLMSLFLSIGLGFLLGILSAIYRGKWQDRALMLLAILGISFPNFVVATLLQYVFSIKLKWFPIAQWGGIAHTILPTLALSALPTAFIARLVRANVIEVLNKDYILTARAKGLSTGRILVRHVLKNALLPVIAYIGHLGASIMTGSFVVEKIFGIPGLGNWFVSSVINRDYTMIMGMTMFFSTFLMLTIFVADIISAAINPLVKKAL